MHLVESLAEADFDVFNFSHEMDIGQVKTKMGHRVAVMGNVPPLDVGVREPPEVVERSALECLAKGAPRGGMILSFGGGVSPGTPPENIDALLKAAREWSRGAAIAAQAGTDEGPGVEPGRVDGDERI